MACAPSCLSPHHSTAAAGGQSASVACIAPAFAADHPPICAKRRAGRSAVPAVRPHFPAQMPAERTEFLLPEHSGKQLTRSRKQRKQLKIITKNPLELFGTKRPWVQIPPLGPVRVSRFGHSDFLFLFCCGTPNRSSSVRLLPVLFLSADEYPITASQLSGTPV